MGDGSEGAHFVRDHLMPRSHRSCWEFLEALETELLGIFDVVLFVDGPSRSLAASLDRLRSTCHSLAVKSLSQGLARVGSADTLEPGVIFFESSPLLHWTGHDANLFSTVVTKKTKGAASCSKRIWFEDLE